LDLKSKQKIDITLTMPTTQFFDIRQMAPPQCSRSRKYCTAVRPTHYAAE